MIRFEVWAPLAKELALRIDTTDDATDIAMTPAADGMWAATVNDAGPGTRYQYVIEGHAYADPRSASQPEGIRGPSMIVDHTAFPWTDRDWHAPPLKSAVAYELHIGTFSEEGTFDGAIEHLDHLNDIGITHIEIMPVNQFSGDYGWGYDGVNLFAPHGAYGGPEGLKRLVNACHARGLAVILDVVYNHLGPVGNSLARFGPYFTNHYSTPWGPAINLDKTGCDHVRRFICDNASMWLRDYHMDGLRLDAIHAFVDTSPIHILEQLSDEVDSLEAYLGRGLSLIAESDLNDPRVVRSRALGGYGMDAQWSDDFHHSVHAVLSGEQNGYYQDFGNVADIAKALQNVWVYDGCYSTHRGRVHGRPATGLRGWQFFVFAQNHDQIGNRAIGDRHSHRLSQGRLKMGAALVLTSPFLPMLFQGEEWAASTPFLYFTNHQEDWAAIAVSEGRRREFAAFGWRREDVPDPQDPQSFERSKLLWPEKGEGDHKAMLEWYKSLIQLRRSRPELTDGDIGKLRVRFDEAQQWLHVVRGSVQAAYNFDSEPRNIALHRAGRILLASSSSQSDPESERLTLAPESVTILESD